MALSLAEQRIGPLDRCLQRVVAARGIGLPTGQQPEALIEQPGDLGRSQRRHPRGGELDRQRDPVQASADLADGGHVTGAQIEVAACGSGPLDEQGHRIAGAGGRHARPRGRQRQRPQPKDLLTAHTEGLPARRQDSYPRQLRRMSAARAAAALSRCSQLSSTSRTVLVRRNSMMLPASEMPGRGRTRRATRTARAIVSPRRRPRGGRTATRHRGTTGAVLLRRAAQDASCRPRPRRPPSPATTVAEPRPARRARPPGRRTS